MSVPTYIIKGDNKFKKISICSNCRREMLIHAKGMCCTCYKKQFWKPRKVVCKRCKRVMDFHAKGLCNGCYNFVFHLEKAKAEQCRRYHNIDYETYKKKTKKCLICGFDKVMELHHLDDNHKNNSENNLIGLCPNHHKMVHNFKYRGEVLTQIQEALADDKSPLPCEEQPEVQINEVEATLTTEAPTIQPLTLLIKNKNLVG